MTWFGRLPTPGLAFMLCHLYSDRRDHSQADDVELTVHLGRRRTRGHQVLGPAQLLPCLTESTRLWTLGTNKPDRPAQRRLRYTKRIGLFTLCGRCQCRQSFQDRHDNTYITYFIHLRPVCRVLPFTAQVGRGVLYATSRAVPFPHTMSSEPAECSLAHLCSLAPLGCTSVFAARSRSEMPMFLDQSESSDRLMNLKTS